MWITKCKWYRKWFGDIWEKYDWYSYGDGLILIVGKNLKSNKNMKVIIAGSRDFNDYGLLTYICNIEIKPGDEIVSGRARGADALGEKYAIEHGYPKRLFPANWRKYGKSAGYRRNEEMAKYGDKLIVFWDGKSKGTKHMIDLAEMYNLEIKTIIFSK